MSTALLIGLIACTLLNLFWAYINMMLADNEMAIGIAAMTGIVCLFAAVYVYTVG